MKVLASSKVKQSFRIHINADIKAAAQLMWKAQLHHHIKSLFLPSAQLERRVLFCSVLLFLTYTFGICKKIQQRISCVSLRAPYQNIMKYLQSEAREKKQAAFQKGWKITIIKVSPTPDYIYHYLSFCLHVVL